MALSTNLVSYWKLDESSGNASDSVGSNTATNSNVTYGTGKINNGAIFNGSSSAFTFATVPVTGSSSFSVSFWLKAGSLVSGMSALHFGTDASNQAFNVYLDASSKIAANFTGGGGQVTSTTSLSPSVFHLFTLTYDGTNLNFRDNGTTKTISNTISFPLYANDGTVALPSYNFTNANNYGLYLTNPTTMSISAGGTNILDFTTTNVKLQDLKSNQYGNT